MIDEQTPKLSAPAAADPDEVDLTELYARLWSRRLVILAFFVLGVGFGIYHTWRLKPAWQANATVVFPATVSSSVAGLAASVGVSLPGQGGSALKLYRAVLESRRAREIVSSRSGIESDKLEKMVKVEDNPLSSLITITVTDRSPTRAIRLTGLFVEALRSLNRSLSLPQARTQAEVLREQLDRTSERLRLAEERQRRLQRNARTAPGVVPGDAAAGIGNRYAAQLREAEIELARVHNSIADTRARLEKLAQPNAQLPSDFPLAKEWRDKLAKLEYELRVEELTYGPEAPSVVKLKEQIALTRQRLLREVSSYLGTVKLNALPDLSSLETTRVGLEAQIRVLRGLAQAAPDENIEMQRVARDVTVLSALAQQLRGQYEMARLQVATDPNRWEVLDEPALGNEGRPVNKRWVRYPAVAGVLGLMVGTTLALVRGTPKRRGHTA